MSEHAPKHERHESGKEHIQEAAEQDKKLEKLIEKAEKVQEKSPAEVEQLSHEAKEKALSKEKTAAEIGKEEETHHPAVIDRAVKQKAYKKTLKHVQGQLPRTQRNFSKFIHQDTVEKVSEITGKTIARPSGLLGGGIFALAGSGLVFWMSHYYGFNYNYFVFIAMLLAGFAAGLVVEALIKSVRKASRRS